MRQKEMRMALLLAQGEEGAAEASGALWEEQQN
jgi:hypothetical protein